MRVALGFVAGAVLVASGILSGPWVQLHWHIFVAWLDKL